ncbi:MAG: hypothetical protein M1423_00810, partial [Acidobacteria bacterium]|nr:hypothetical protein [Acidobacteriota bacterium]
MRRCGAEQSEPEEGGEEDSEEGAGGQGQEQAGNFTQVGVEKMNGEDEPHRKQRLVAVEKQRNVEPRARQELSHERR